MPYVDAEARQRLSQGGWKPALRVVPQTKGELNYVLTKIVLEYVAEHGTSYAVLSDARAALNDASSEFYRRMMAPYEDQKIIDNGDVYP